MVIINLNERAGKTFLKMVARALEGLEGKLKIIRFPEVTETMLSSRADLELFRNRCYMTFELLLKALMLGVINAAPLGPVGLLCLRKNLAPDRRRGLCAGLGMAVAYGIIAFCVLFGLKAIATFLKDYETLFQIVGGLVLVVMGCRGLRSSSAPQENDLTATRYLGEFSASFAMTLFNPVPFATFTLILTSFQVFDSRPDLQMDLFFAGFVSLGTLLFWLSMNEALHHVKKRSPELLYQRIGYGTSVALLAFGVILAAKGIF
jgi:threonine/homoserine/homoserine lactone efflux protein